MNPYLPPEDRSLRDSPRSVEMKKTTPGSTDDTGWNFIGRQFAQEAPKEVFANILKVRPQRSAQVALNAPEYCTWRTVWEPAV